MALVWGSWAGPSGQRERVGIDLTASGTTITEKYFIEAESSMNDNQSMKITGARSETIGFTANTPQAGAVQLVATRTRTGTRGTSYSYSATVTGIYTGATATVSNVSITVPAAPPSAPGQPSVSGVTSGKANIAWSAPSSNNGGAVTGYQIQFAYDAGFTAGVATGSTATASYTLSTTQSNTTFWVRVRAQNSAGYGAWSASRSFTTLPVAPAAPSGVTLARVSDASQTVAWTNNATGAAPYAQVFVNRRDNVATSWVRVATLSGTPTSFTDTSTVANRRYEYIVAASNTGGTSGWTVSTAINTTPAAPSNVAAVKSGSNIAVSWTRNATYTGVTQHVIQDNPGGTGWTNVATVGAVDYWTHASVNASVTHQYRVLAKSTVNAVLDSVWSSPSAVVQLLAPPLAPTVLAPSGVINRASTFTISWTHNPVDTTGQAAYEILYRVNGGAWDTYTGTTAQTRLIQPVGVSGTYEWQVRTRGEHATYGPWSAVKSVQLAAKPSVVINSPVDGSTLDQSKVTVTWGYSSGDASPQAQWEATLKQDGSTLEVRAGSGTAGSVAFDRALSDQESYTVHVRVRAASGLWSDWAVQSFAVDYPEPVKPIVSLDWQPDTGSVEVGIDNPPSATDSFTITNLFTNPSFEASSGTVEVRRNYHVNPGAVSLTGYAAYAGGTGNTQVRSTVDVSWSHSGKAAQSEWVESISDAGDFGPRIDYATAGETWTIAYDVAVGRDGSVLAGVQFGGTVGGSTLVARSHVDPEPLAEGQVQRRWMTFVKSETVGTDLRSSVGIVGRQAGDKIRISNVDLYPGAYNPSREAFSGSYSPDTDLTPEWVGAVNESASRLIGSVPADTAYQTGVGQIVQSTAWKAGGTYSCRVIPVTSSTTTWVGPGGSLSTGVYRLGMQPGRTYTIAVWCRLERPLTGTLATLSRRIVALREGWAGFALSDPAPNEAGVHLLRLTFTVPESATSAAVRLYAGSSVGNGDVWFDNFTIVEGEHPDLMPFSGRSPSETTQDGYTVSYQWNGAGDASTSTASYSPAPETVSNAVYRQIGDGEWVLIADNLPANTTVTDPLPSLLHANRYRAISKTALETEAIGPEVELTAPRQRRIFANTGPGFRDFITYDGDPAISQATGRASSTEHMAGISHPVNVRGSHLTATYSASGTLTSASSSREDIENFSYTDDVICYRDPSGRRVFANLDEMSVGGTLLEKVSYAFTRIEYDEGQAYVTEADAEA